MISSIDTNILIDIVGEKSDFYDESSTLLENQSGKGSLIISPIVYSELLATFIKEYGEHEFIGKVNGFLTELGIRISEFTKEDFELAGKVWHKYASLRNVACSKCGAVNIFSCKKCSSPVFWRNHVLPDFLIGAHAENHSNVLLTRDKAYYKKFFNVKLLP
ncbi:type II toxin-antitoxin system VapC family toxin [Candidatus Woesearchaeota archaeon]|nr:type II toxin-antitoxin system VapC family toxin [Candidatus Woesearchaeota archaeon]